MAYVQLKEAEGITLEELFEYYRHRISWHKLPKRIEIVDEFPLTASGKVQKYKLREMAIEKYNLHDVDAIETA